MDGVETEIDLYYSKDGVLVKKLVDADNDYDYGDYIPAAPVEGVEAFLKANFPNARILDIDREDNMTEVEILDGQVVRELLFDKVSNWLFTKTETVYAALPVVVKQALEASEYAGYHVDDVDHYATPEEEYYRLELESVKGDVKVKITAAGVLSLMEYSPSDPGNNTGGVLPGKSRISLHRSMREPVSLRRIWKWHDGSGNLPRCSREGCLFQRRTGVGENPMGSTGE